MSSVRKLRHPCRTATNSISSSTHMKDILDANLSLFSPNLCHRCVLFPDSTSISRSCTDCTSWTRRRSALERQQFDQIMEFEPYYYVGNCITGKSSRHALGRGCDDRISMDDISHTERLSISHSFMTANAFAQLSNIIIKHALLNRQSAFSILKHNVSKPLRAGASSSSSVQGPSAERGLRVRDLLRLWHR